MPCYDPQNTYSQGKADGAADTERRLRAEFRHNSDVAQMLCEVMRYLEDQYLIDNNQHLSPELRAWWREHQERDRAKLRR